MKVTCLLMALFLFSDCKVHKNIEKSTLHVDSTATSSKELARVATIHQTGTDSTQLATFANSQSNYTSQTVEYDFALYTGEGGGDKGNAHVYDSSSTSLPVSLPADLKKRLVSMKVKTERGQQAKQAGGISHQNRQWQTTGQDSLNAKQQQTADLQKDLTTTTKQVDKSGGGIGFKLVLCLGVIAFIVGWAIYRYVKGFGIFGLFRQQDKQPPQSAAAGVIDVAASQVGKQEVPKGSNWGPTVKKYLKSVGIGFAAFWCMAFVYYCVSTYCDHHGIKNPLFKTGSVRIQWQHCKLMRVDLKTDRPRPGDIFMIMRPDGSNHCGFVERVEGDRIYTIEGNSNEDGSSDGYEVCRKPGGRPISSITGFIRPVYTK